MLELMSMWVLLYLIWEQEVTEVEVEPHWKCDYDDGGDVRHLPRSIGV